MSITLNISKSVDDNAPSPPLQKNSCRTDYTSAFSAQKTIAPEI